MAVGIILLYVVLLVLLYMIMAISGYFHVKNYKADIMTKNKSDPK